MKGNERETNRWMKQTHKILVQTARVIVGIIMSHRVVCHDINEPYISPLLAFSFLWGASGDWLNLKRPNI